MDQVKSYLAIALNVAFLVCFLMLMWQFLIHKQWLIFFLSLFFALVCGGTLVDTGPLSVGPGYLIAMVVGWQEAKNWKIKNLMRVYTGLFLVCFVMFVQSTYATLTTHKEPDMAKLSPKQKAALAKQKAAGAKIKIR